MVYTKILVALDGSDSSKRALHRAVVLAEKFGSKLTLLTVFHRRVLLPLVEEGGEMAVDDEIHESYWDSVRDLHVGILEGAERLMRESYPKARVEAVLVEGRPSVEICREAREREVGLVVVGNSGVGGIKGWLLGSTSRSVVDSCSATVMVVK